MCATKLAAARKARQRVRSLLSRHEEHLARAAIERTTSESGMRLFDDETMLGEKLGQLCRGIESDPVLSQNVAS